MLPPGEFEVPIPLSISNDLSANIRGPSDNDQNDIDRFRIAIPVSESAAFNMSVIVEPVGTAIDQRGYQLSVSGRNGLGPIVGNCSGLSSIDDPLIKQDLRIRIHSFDVFSGDFNEVLFENSTGPGEPEIVTDFSVPSGVFYVSIEGDGGELQLYNLTLTIQRPLIREWPGPRADFSKQSALRRLTILAHLETTRHTRQLMVSALQVGTMLLRIEQFARLVGLVSAQL